MNIQSIAGLPNRLARILNRIREKIGTADCRDLHKK
jgi:hypothetical protein